MGVQARQLQTWNHTSPALIALRISDSSGIQQLAHSHARFVGMHEAEDVIQLVEQVVDRHVFLVVEQDHPPPRKGGTRPETATNLDVLIGRNVLPTGSRTEQV